MYRSADPLGTGRMFGPYQIIHKIGQGGMATIYRAYQPTMDRDVAIKVLPQEFIGDREFYARFVQEARLIARIEHPHILPVYDFGEVDGMPYLVMRHLDWGTLKDLLIKQPLALKTIDRIFTQLARALGHAHGMGVIHRDIKPSNVMVDQYGNIFLTDFGIARLVESTTKFTPTGALSGTPAYISPEQAKGEHQPDFRTDIYSLGVVLYEMFTGRLPFEADTPVAMLMKKINDPPTHPSVINPDLPAAIENVILKALAQNPDERYQSMSEFLEAWRTALTTIGETSIDSSDEEWDVANGESEHPGENSAGSLRSDRKYKPKRPPARVKNWVIPVAILVIILIAINLYAYFQIIQPGNPFNLAFGPSAVALMQPSAPPVILPTASHTPTPSQTPTTGPPSPTPVITSTQSIATGTPSAIRRIYGPLNGILPHGAQNKVQQVFSQAKERDFVVKATFYNPYSGGKSIWDINIFFRSPDGKDGFRLVVRSDESWELFDHRQVGLEAHLISIVSGSLVGLNPRTDGSNTIRLIAIGDTGYFFLNDYFMARLDLSKRNEAGDIAIGTGFSPNSQIAGEQTRFTDFSVWSITPVYGPARGDLIHTAMAGPVASTVHANLWNFVAQARVTNPYPSAMRAWSEGFSFRSNGPADQYRVFAQSDSMIKFGELKNGLTSWISESKPANLKLGQGDTNELTLVAWGNEGLFFINGMWVAKLDLSSRQYPGDIAISSGFFGSDQIKGKSTHFQGFTIWELP